MTYMIIAFDFHHIIFKVDGISSLTKEQTEAERGK